MECWHKNYYNDKEKLIMGSNILGDWLTAKSKSRSADRTLNKNLLQIN